MMMDQETKSKVSKILRVAIDDLLRLGVNYRLHHRIFTRSDENFREEEALMHQQDYPVRGFGIIATPANIEGPTFLYSEELVEPEELSSMTGSLPFEAAIASYAFTLLEVCGDDVIRLVNPSFQERSWHAKIPDREENLNNKGFDVCLRMFGDAFAVEPTRILRATVSKLVEMKEARNDFIHRGRASVSFETFLSHAISVAIQIYFALLPDETMLKSYPFNPHDDKWN